MLESSSLRSFFSPLSNRCCRYCCSCSSSSVLFFGVRLTMCMLFACVFCIHRVNRGSFVSAYTLTVATTIETKMGNQQHTHTHSEEEKKQRKQHSRMQASERALFKCEKRNWKYKKKDEGYKKSEGRRGMEHFHSSSLECDIINVMTVAAEQQTDSEYGARKKLYFANLRGRWKAAISTVIPSGE